MCRLCPKIVFSFIAVVPRRSRLLCYVIIPGTITWIFTYILIWSIKEKKHTVYHEKHYGYTDPLGRREASQIVPQGDFNLTCPDTVDHEYKSILKKMASNRGVLLLALADDSYLDMTLNFYETSLKPLAINNFLFVSPFNKTCRILRKYDLACHVYKNNLTVKANTSKRIGKSEYGTAIFNKKMVMRTRAIIDALLCGITLLHTDVDITLFKNPFPYFKCSKCDIEVLEDGWSANLNAGFVYLRPTKATLDVYSLILNITSNPKYDDQVAFNAALKKYRKRINVKALNTRLFPCGLRYFENSERHFVDDMRPCTECVMVHNNWIVSKEAKVYRFKETGMWMYDHEIEQYYSSVNRKYLIYNNPLQLSNEESVLNKLENDSLVSALAIGRILNRTVILPKFHCSQRAKQCPFNSLYRVSDMDKHFPSKFRESVFLQHPKVPDIIKNSQSPLVFINTNVPYADLCKPIQEIERLVCIPANPLKGATSAEIRRCLEPLNQYSILRFHSLYSAFSHFIDRKEQAAFSQSIRAGLTRTVYRQYPTSVVRKMGKKKLSLKDKVYKTYIDVKKYFFSPVFECHSKFV